MSGCRNRKRCRKLRHSLRRRDVCTRMVVELGIQYAELMGQAFARDFLQGQAVPAPVIQRLFPQNSLR